MKSLLDALLIDESVTSWLYLHITKANYMKDCTGNFTCC